MIDSFDNLYSFLSNFYPSKVLLDQVEYSSVEHAYQAAKTNDLDEREIIRQTATPALAKKAGRHVEIRDDWEHEKYTVMENLLRQKFSHPQLKNALLDTGEEELIEGNWWGDKVWGCVKKNNKWVGQNNLGKLLMKIRSELCTKEPNL